MTPEPSTELAQRRASDAYVHAIATLLGQCWDLSERISPLCSTVAGDHATAARRSLRFIHFEAISMLNAAASVDHLGRHGEHLRRRIVEISSNFSELLAALSPEGADVTTSSVSMQRVDLWLDQQCNFFEDALK